eukprot:jgi/Chlat1/2751/Chrsp187S02930
MMRRSSRKAPATSTAAAPSGGSRAAKELEKIDGVFAKYTDPNDPESIGPDGVEALCSDLGVSPGDLSVLLFAWKLGAERMGYFSLEEWRRGLRAMRVDSLDKLKKALPSLESEVRYSSAYQDFYTFAFQYCLTEPRQKTLDLDTASQMLSLVMKGRPHLEDFVQFLHTQSEYKAMNQDQWLGFLRLSDEVKTDFSNYDENQAWPLLMDNYVDWGRDRRQRS